METVRKSGRSAIMAIRLKNAPMLRRGSLPTMVVKAWCSAGLNRPKLMP